MDDTFTTHQYEPPPEVVRLMVAMMANQRARARGWWAEDETQIATLERADTHITTAHARQTVDGWEYAVTVWMYGTPRLQVVFLNGRVIDEMGAPIG